MSAEPIFAGCVWTESRPERRKSLERTLAAANGDPRFEIQWCSSGDVAASDVSARYYRESAKPFAGLSGWRAWLILRRNVQTTMGSSRRLAGAIAVLAAGWNIVRGRGLKIDAPPSPNSDDCARKHLLGIERFIASDANWLLGLEDDALGEAGWPEWIVEITEQLSKYASEPVFVATSEGAGLERTGSDPAPDRLGLFRVNPPTTRTACAYLMNRSAAMAFRELLAEAGVREDAGMGFDFLIAFLALRNGTRVYWTEPPVFAHGSERGVENLASTIPRLRH